MAKSLGIFVTNPSNMRHVVGVTKAAVAKGSKVKVFFTWWGTKLTQDPEFPTLCAMDNVDVSICADSYKKAGFDVEVIPGGLTKEKMATQAQHGAIIENYDCYMTL
jgi:peroxiredoxin family protein